MLDIYKEDSLNVKQIIIYGLTFIFSFAPDYRHEYVQNEKKLTLTWFDNFQAKCKFKPHQKITCYVNKNVLP